MGLLDLPSPLLSWADAAALGALPPWARLGIWGVVAALLSMGTYGLLSPQHRIAWSIAEQHRLTIMLRDEQTGAGEGLAVSRRLLAVALGRIGLVIGPVLAAAVPVLCLMTWLDARYGYDFPPVDEIPVLQVRPPAAHIRWVVDGGGVARVEILDADGEVVQAVPLHMAVPVVHKRVWWNFVAGNPIGYLAPDGPAERIDIGLPVRRYLDIAPGWLGSWEALFLGTLIAVSLLIKRAARLQ